MFYKSWFDAGITEVNNLLNEQGDILELHDFTWKFYFNVSLTKYSNDLQEVTFKKFISCLF